MILYVSSQHRFTNRNYRPSDAEYDTAKAATDAAGLNMNQLVRALLREFNESPQQRIAALAIHLRVVAEDTPRGRPMQRGPATQER